MAVQIAGREKTRMYVITYSSIKAVYIIIKVIAVTIQNKTYIMKQIKKEERILSK